MIGGEHEEEDEDDFSVFRKSADFPAKGRFVAQPLLSRQQISSIATGQLSISGDFFGRTPIPLGKNANKWHKSASYGPGRNSTFGDF